VAVREEQEMSVEDHEGVVSLLREGLAQHHLVQLWVQVMEEGQEGEGSWQDEEEDLKVL